MKILSAEQIREADRYTMAHEPVGPVELMERAARACADRIISDYVYSAQNDHGRILVFCGTGNNGGDGLVIARLLSEYVKEIAVFVVAFSEKYSPEFQVNYDRLLKVSNARIQFVKAEADMPALLPNDLILDCIFGSGLNRPPQGLAADVIRAINRSQADVIAVDVPSGFFCDNNPHAAEGTIVKAQKTYTFEFPKLSFLYDANQAFVGEWLVVPIGLHPEYVEEVEVSNTLLEIDLIRPLLKKRPATAHKGTFGHALMLAGSYGKVGAALLASLACLRTGAGLLTVHLPECGYVPLQSSLPEAMVSVDETHEKHLGALPQDVERFQAVGIGPGIGQAQATAEALHQLLQSYRRPMVIDADALNLLAAHPEWLALLPPNSILTPHPKEFERLAGTASDAYQRHQLQLEMARKYQVCIVLKGAHTCIALPNGQSYFNSTGNPGMATAGSGDVLTGMLTALLAQGYAPHEACLLGVYLHGLAGDLAADRRSQEALIARDIVAYLGKAFQQLHDDLPF